jgi:hypothetical protein
MAKMSELRKQAKNLGIAVAEIREASSVEKLQALIDAHGSNGTASKPRKKAAVKKAVAKKSVAKSSAAKKSASSKATPAKSTRKSGTAKRSSAAKRSTSKVSTSGYVAKGGRNLLDGVNYGETDGWNARNGSAPDRIVKALKKFRGNREKAFDFLVGDVWDFVGKKFRDGTKRTKADAEGMLRYRISRTAWDFARATGQHDPATNRVQYGTGGTGAGTWKPAKKSATKKASSTRKATATRKKTGASRKASAARKTTARSGRKTASRRKR